MSINMSERLRQLNPKLRKEEVRVSKLKFCKFIFSSLQVTLFQGKFTSGLVR
jgi:hypothetical protein